MRSEAISKDRRDGWRERRGAADDSRVAVKSRWHSKPVSEIAKHSLGKMLDKTKNKGTPRPYLRNLNVRWFEFHLGDLAEMRFLDEEAPKFTALKGDVLICEGGYPGRAAVWESDEPIFFQKAIHRVRFHEHGRNRWFVYYLYYLDATGQLRQYFTGTGIQHFTGETLARLPVPLPPLVEQQRIVAILDEAFAAISAAKANTKKNLQNARAVFESHLHAVFAQRGCECAEKRLDEISTFSSGGTPSKSNSSYWSGKIPWVSGRDMKSTRLSDSALHISQAAVDESSTRIASAGTLLVLVRGMGLAHGAQIAELLVPCAFNQDIRGIEPKPGLLPQYLLFALRNRINLSDTVLSNAAHGTLKIDSDELQKLMIPFPPIEQQRRVIALIDRLSIETQRLASISTRKLSALDALKASLLHHAFTGQRRRKGPPHHMTRRPASLPPPSLRPNRAQGCSHGCSESSSATRGRLRTDIVPRRGTGISPLRAAPPTFACLHHAFTGKL